MKYIKFQRKCIYHCNGTFFLSLSLIYMCSKKIYTYSLSPSLIMWVKKFIFLGSGETASASILIYSILISIIVIFGIVSIIFYFVKISRRSNRVASNDGNNIELNAIPAVSFKIINEKFTKNYYYFYYF